MMSGYSVMIIDTYKTLLEKFSRFLTEKNGKSSECSILAVPDNVRGLSKNTKERGKMCLYQTKKHSNIHLSDRGIFSTITHTSSSSFIRMCSRSCPKDAFRER